MKDSINKETLEYFYICYTVNANAPFSQVENLDFRVLLQYINPAANNALPYSQNKIQFRVMELYVEGKRRVSFMLQPALSSIHITCDAWTTPNHLVALDVVSHFTSEKVLLRELLLSLSEQEGSHSGQNQARLVLKTLTSYKIRNRLGHFVMNDASTNDTLMEYIAENLEDEGIAYDPRQHSLRCNGHIINQTVCAFLFGKHPDAERQADGAIESQASPSIKS